MTRPLDDDENQTMDEESVATLPLKLDSLKRQIRRHIPLLQLMRKPLDVVITKQPSLEQRKKGARRHTIQRMAWQYWYDPLDLIRTILSATYLTEKMHFGMAQYVDEPTELWHSLAWGSSIRTTSGDVCYTKAGAMIIPGDMVRIRCPPFRIGRVIFIGHDFRHNATGEIVVTVQAIAESREKQRVEQSILGQFLPDLDLSDQHEYFLLEDYILEVSVSDINRHLAIHLDREFSGSEDDEAVFTDDRFYIRRVLNLSQSTIRPIRQLHQIRGELEVSYFGRNVLEVVASKPHLSLPYILFIDDFGIHRNMYRALKAFYLIPASLSYDERRKLANVFTLTLGPHGAKIEDVIGAISRPVQELDQSIDLEINGEIRTVWAFSISLIGDMPQQADNSGFQRPIAFRGCRSCVCPKESYGDLDFDTVLNGRYHWETIQQREHAQSIQKSGQLREFLKDTGVRQDAPPISKLAPSLDLIRTRPYDAPHSEWRGLGRILQSFLMTSILSKSGKLAYLKAFQNFQFPPGWKRIQSPMFYIWSWTLSEAGRATILAPLILRSKSTIRWFRLPFLQAVSKVMDRQIETTALRAIIRAFGIIARSNTLVGSQRYTEPSVLHQHIVEARKAYQDLIRCAIATKGSRQNDDQEIEDDDDGDLQGATDADKEAALRQIIDEAEAEYSDDNIDDEALGIVQPRPSSKVVKKPAPKNKLERLLKLPNVHAGLHLADNAREYATVMNSNVLAGELKHKYSIIHPILWFPITDIIYLYRVFKGMADAASPPNLMGYLFARDVIYQSLRLGLAGAWDHDHPEIVDALRLLDSKCSLLVKSFLPTNELAIDDDESSNAQSTNQHFSVQLSLRGFSMDGHFRMRATTNLMRLSPQHDFVQHFMAAYRKDYGMNVMDFGPRPLRWFRRIAFSDT